MTDSRERERQIRTTYFYSFSGARSLQQVDSLANEVYSLNGVTEFKASFKPSSLLSEIRITVVEKFAHPESPVTFHGLDVKNLLLKHGYSPLSSSSYIHSEHKH